jgi:hypothetical protein
MLFWDLLFARLTCPKCGRSDFSKRVGFINHCLNSHNFSCVSAEDWNRVCGVAVPESDIPANDPCRNEQIVTNFKNLDMEMTEEEERIHQGITEKKVFLQT